MFVEVLLLRERKYTLRPYFSVYLSGPFSLVLLLSLVSRDFGNKVLLLGIPCCKKKEGETKKSTVLPIQMVWTNSQICHIKVVREVDRGMFVL